MHPITTTTNANALREQGECTKQSNYSNGIFTHQSAPCKPTLGFHIWRLTYITEEARARYSDNRQLLKQAAACLALYFLKMAGG